MRLFSSKKICLGIAAAAVLFAAALVGVSAYRSVAARHTFAEDGYILTVEEDEEQIVVNRQNSFAAGSRYASAGVSSVSYQNADGGSVRVDGDSFIHYESSSLASVADGTIADLDDYLDGVIGCYSLAAGNTLSWTGSVFTIASGDGEKQFENFVWKSSAVRCLMGSPQLTVGFSGGQEEVVTSGFLELSYMDEEGSVVQLTDGENAWQVVAEGCSITFANGVVLDAASGNILTPEEAEDYAAGEMVSVRLSLGTIEIDASAYTSLGTSTSYASTQSSPPSFLFTIVNGADGEDGSDGADGEEGADGVEGEAGAQGADGADGEDGSAGSGGIGGYTDTTVRNGTVTVGDNVYTGQPEVIVCEDTWNIMSDGTFSLAYDEDSYDAIDVATNSAHVYLYNVETGEIIQEWGQNDDLTLTDQATEFSIYDENAKYKGVVLETGTTYALIVTDTYTLGGTTYTAKVMERMFTTDDTSLTASLTARTSESFSASLGSYTSVSSVTLTVKDADGEVVTTQDGTSYEDYVLSNAVTNPSSFEITGLSPDTWYSVELTVEAVPEGGTVAVSSTFSFEWTTLKEAPTVGGVSLTASSGYLTAEILGAYDSEKTAYGEVVDDYDTIESVTYYLYTVDTADTTVLALSDIQTSTAGGSWPVYFENVVNNTVYYVIAEYSWTDGTSSYTAAVMESGTYSAPDYNTTDDGALTSPAGRAWASAKAQSGSGIILSFSGSSEIRNSSTDTSLGTTYESIKGSVNVNLNGTRIRVDSVRTLSLTVTDNLTYEKTWTFDNAGGVEGDVEGIFALPVDLDGLLISTTYSMTLSGYVYGQNSDTPTLQTLGTLTVRTDDEAEVDFGMQVVDTGGIGVEFALGGTSYEKAIAEEALYDLSSGAYVESFDDYYNATSAAYRNLSSIVFELYALDNVSKDTSKNVVDYSKATETLIGTCEVGVLDENTGEKATVTPGYSLLYQNYYGKNATESGTNTVGVGEEFNYRFEYASSTNRSGEVSTEYIEQVSDYYRIKVTLCYDYTYDRYTYEASDGEDTPYDYILYTKGLDLDDYVNEPTINTEASYVNIPWQDRPISPTSSYVLDSSGSAITAEPLANGEVDDFAWSQNASNSGLYDAALEETTDVGMSLETTFTDSSARTRRVSFYGMNYALDTVWENTYESVSLSEVADVEEVLPFKFTLWMTQDGEAPDDDTLDEQVADESESWRTTIPMIYLLIGADGMDEPTYGSLNWESVDAYSDSNDRGYYWRAYDESAQIWYVYVSESFLERGKTYRFYYDALMYYSDSTWPWPETYYEKQWIANGYYTKNTALSSIWTAFEKQTPSVELTLQSSNTSGDTWQVYLNDPDDALVSHTLLGYNTESKVNSSPIWSDSLLGGVVDATGASVSTQTIKEDEKYIEIEVKDAATTLSYINYSDADTYSHTEYNTAYSNKYYAVVTGVTGSTTDDVTASDEELTAMEKIVTALKAADKSGGTAGATVVCSNIGVGQYYSWRAGCQTIDDYYPSSYRATVTLLGHQYSGTGTMTKTGWTGNVETEDKAGFYIDNPDLDDDNDEAKIFLLRADGTSSVDYVAAMRRIAAVEIVVENEDYASDPSDDNKYTFWSGLSYGLNGSNIYGYYFSFSISVLPSGFYTVGEKLTLEYTFYYYNGESSFEVDTSGYYALRSVTYRSDADYYEQLKSASSTAQLSYSTSASSSIYWFKEDSSELSRSYATSNSGDVYLTGFTQSWTLSGAPLASWYSEAVTRTEDLSWGGADLSVGYDAGLVTEFCALATFTAEGSVTAETLAPVLSSLPVVTSGLTEAKVTVQIGNYGLMDYPDDGTGNVEDFHLYYVLYEVTEDTDSDGLPVLALKGAMIGDAIDATTDGSDPIQTITLTELEPDKTYYLYIYYKDNRGTTEDTKAQADSTLFATAYNSGYEDGTFTTDATMAARLESVINNADPRSNDAWNFFTKISGQGTHQLTEASTDANGTVHAATYDYYCLIEPVDGIEISSMKFDLGNDDPYYSTSNVDASGKTLSCSVTVSYMQDEGTVAYFILERCATNLNQSLPSNWKTVLMPEDYTTVVGLAGASSVYCTPAIETTGSLTAGHYEFYATYDNSGALDSDSDYQYTGLAETSSGVYTASMSLTYYPTLGGVIEPGYVYRMKALVYQLTYDGDDLKSAELVSIDSTDSTQSYSTSQTTWSVYSYSSDNPLINVTNLDWSDTTLTCYIKAQTGYYTWLDRTYYVRLCEWDATKGTSGEWVILDESDITYGSITSGGKTTSIYDYAFGVEDSSTQLTFTDLESGTTYSIQFFGLIDTDYDGYVNIASDGTPLAAEYTTTPTFENLKDWYPTSDSAGTSPYDEGRSSNLSTLKTYYFGDGTDVADGDLSDVLLCQSKSVKTMGEGTSATIGSYYDYNVVSATELELYFEDAAGLASTSISQIEWTLHYVGITGSQGDRSGTTSSVKNTYSSSTTLTDDVTVTITDSGTNFQQNGHWYFTLKITYADETEENVDSWEIEFTEF